MTRCFIFIRILLTVSLISACALAASVKGNRLTHLGELVSSGMSLMPEGFEQVLQPQDLANLIGYLAVHEKRVDPVPGVDPSVIG